MNDQQIKALLGAAMAYDHRKPGEAMVSAWMESASRARWTYPEALEAIHAHYAEDTEYLKPGHITQRIRASRRQPAAFQPLAIERKPAGPQEFKAIITELSKRMGWDRTQPAAAPSSSVTATGLDVECPHCHAMPKRPCVRSAGPAKKGQLVPISDVHASRRETALRMAS